ncbi:RNA polymerase I-associated factor PAF67-domain-containing protein [Ochromonadaceae sp. CCMP2298]|nr:RNA polymerase I-associated factor PAF67-domain-containing protein [Ochromonadaceae sp. CCMP2298]
MEDAPKVDFTLPAPITDFLFDLHDAMRRGRRVEEVQILYDSKFKEITDKYFSQSPWPDSAVIAPEVNSDEGFLVFYREMAMRHVTTRLKPQVADHISSWANYVKLFDSILATGDDELAISTQWVYDICQEFAYQFQGFCQFRCQMASVSSNPETLKALEANRDAWNLPQVMSILRRLVNAGAGKAGKVGTSSTFLAQFGYFASIELARLECLLGDFSASLAAVSDIKLGDRSELFLQLPLCHFNVYYHTGVCNLMLRRFATAADVFSEIILHVSRLLKPGAGTSLRGGLQQQLQRMMDKALALTALAAFLHPSKRLDDQVRDLMEAKFADKIHKLQNPDSFQKSFTDLFDFASPKFISPVVPDYFSDSAAPAKNDASSRILSVLLGEVMQHQNVMRLKSFLSLYATIDVAKLARFNELTEAELICQLLSYKNKNTQIRPGTSVRVNTSDVNYYVDTGAIVIDSSSSKTGLDKTYERFFTAGVRKHVEIINQMNRTFGMLDM